VTGTAASTETPKATAALVSLLLVADAGIEGKAEAGERLGGAFERAEGEDDVVDSVVQHGGMILRSGCW
jgi:hypothetical protein